MSQTGNNDSCTFSVVCVDNFNIFIFVTCENSNETSLEYLIYFYIHLCKREITEHTLSWILLVEVLLYFNLLVYALI